MYGLMIDSVNMVMMLMPLNLQNFDYYAVAILGLTVAVTLVIGIWHAHKGAEIKEVVIPLKNLPVAFEGFKIAQISDLHVGPTIGRRYTQTIVDKVNDLKPDLIVLTGDFVDGTVRDLKDGVAPLADLKAPYGCFFVTGNHEYYWGVFSWIEHFKNLGMTVLINEHKTISREDDAIILAGVTDYSAGHMVPQHASNPSLALQGAPGGLVKILLAHQPASYSAAEQAGFDLQLSGHTHAGQYFPFTFIIRFFQRYYKGLNRHGNLWIYVNTGTGYWGPPLRTKAAEITLVTLKREH
jgi:predicted MPP superfamily phosphohydrolase